MTDIDPRLHAIAVEAIRDLVAEVGREQLAGRQDQLVARLEQALQQSLEQEYAGFVKELTE